MSLQPAYHLNGRTSANTIAASDSSDEFPFFAADTTAIETLTVSAAPQTGAKLLKVHVALRLFDQLEQRVLALLDGGSTHSFISPSILTKSQLAIAADRDQCMRRNFCISVATGDAKSSCCVTTASLRIGEWQGDHEFVISGAVAKHEVILGRDFFKRHCVVVDHVHDVVQLGATRLCVNTADATVQQASAPISNDIIEANQRSIFNELKALREALSKSSPCSSSSSSSSSISSSSAIHAHEPVINGVHDSLAVTCIVASDTIVQPRSQRLVPFSTTAHLPCECVTSLFEPTSPLDANILVARSVHTPNSDLFCNVINPTDAPIMLKANSKLGSLTDAEEANVKFDEDVLSYVPLDVDVLKCEAAASSNSLSTPDVSQRVATLRISNKLAATQRKQLSVLLSRHLSAFQWNPLETGRTKLVEHSIPTGDSAPIQQRQYPIPSIAREPLTKQVEDMLE